MAGTSLDWVQQQPQLLEKMYWSSIDAVTTEGLIQMLEVVVMKVIQKN